MQSGILFPAIIALIIGGVFFLQYYFSRKSVVKRKLKKAAGMKMSSFYSGDIAKVAGSVEIIGEPLIAPLSGRPCAYYYVLVEQLQSSGKSSHYSKLIEEEKSGTFLIRDGRYRAKINSDSQLKTYLVQDKEYSSGLGNDATAALENFLNSNGEKSENFLGFNKTIRYKEGILEAGEMVAVTGRGEWKTAREAQLPETYGRILLFSSAENEPIYMSDDPETISINYNDLTVQSGMDQQ